MFLNKKLQLLVSELYITKMHGATIEKILNEVGMKAIEEPHVQHI